MNVKTSLLVAVDQSGTIGNAGDLPWHLRTDLRRFRNLTTGHVVICGRLTHESIVRRLGHPLPKRTTIVVSSTPRANESNLFWYPNPIVAIGNGRGMTERMGQTEQFVIGGLQLYTALLPHVDRILLTRVGAASHGDTTIDLDQWLTGFALESESADAQDDGDDFPMRFLTYERNT